MNPSKPQSANAVFSKSNLFLKQIAVHFGGWFRERVEGQVYSGETQSSRRPGLIEVHR
jgi:hypothetical protein